jgi:hypothetical protein
LGRIAVPKQVSAFLECRFFSQLMNVDAAIRQHAGLSVDPADPGVRGNNSFQTLSSNSSRHSLLNSLFIDDVMNSLKCPVKGPLEWVGARLAVKMFITQALDACHGK